MARQKQVYSFICIRVCKQVFVYCLIDGDGVKCMRIVVYIALYYAKENLSSIMKYYLYTYIIMGMQSASNKIVSNYLNQNVDNLRSSL